MGQGRTTFHLTYRQQQIVDLVLDGASNRQIAERLGLSEQTIKNQLTTIYEKLGISNRLQLAMLAVRERRRPS
jgi:DNA-binding NarL/FixJ family response regulator